MRRFQLALIAAAGAASLLVSSFAHTAYAADPFGTLAGAWRGVGRVMMPSGQSEHLTCKAYYTAKDGGTGLGIALQCASAGNKIDLRATIVNDGTTIKGEWEERSFNSTGTVSGNADDSKIELTIDGTLKATMSITLEGESQLISISTEGTGFKSVDLELLRG